MQELILATDLAEHVKVVREIEQMVEGMWRFIVAALCNRAGHYIFALWFLSIFFCLSFFSGLISAAAGWMSTIL